MADNYAKIVDDNIKKLFLNPREGLEKLLPGEREGDGFVFPAFGERCVIKPDGIVLGGEEQKGILGILISLYALNVGPGNVILEPFKAFREFPNSMPYVGAFTSHTEQILVPHVHKLEAGIDVIMEKLGGEQAPESQGGDISFVLYPLPKIALCYILYRADEDFPASATCLYSNNANDHIPMDGLADVGEYTSKKIIDLL